MKMTRTVLTLLLLAFTSMLVAQHQLSGPAPEGLLTIADLQKLPGCEYVKTGPHGMKACGYSSLTNLKLLKNIVGEGYEIQVDKFENIPTIYIEDIKFSNLLGLNVGLNRTQVLGLLEFTGKVESDTIMWSSKKTINDRQYDVNTWLTMNFSGEMLAGIRVFTTTTY